MTTCIVFRQVQEGLTIQECGGPSKPERSQSDIWRFDDPAAQPTEVGIEGKKIYDPTLRKSKSVRDKFSLRVYDLYQISHLFTKFHVGVGSKHMYEEGDFMKEHYDSRQPPQEGGRGVGQVSHIMTLILTKDLSHLKVNGKSLEAPDDKNDDGYAIVYGVLFSLNCPHEVTPVKTKRVSFVFPIFGVYDPITSISKNRNYYADHKQKPKPVAQLVLDQVEKVISLEKQCKKDAYDLRQLYGYIKALRNEDTTLRMQRVCFLADEYIGEEINERAVLRLTDTPWLEFRYAKLYQHNKMEYYNYYTEHTISVRHWDLKDKHFPAISGVPALLNCLLNLKTDIEALIASQEAEEEEEELDQENEEDEEKEDGGDGGDTFPVDQPFAVICSGRYFQDQVAPQDLTQFDRQVYERLVKMGRKMKFVPVAEHPDLPKVFYIWQSGKVTTQEPKHKIGYTTNIYTEFDDASSYDPRFSLVHGVFLIE